MSQSDKTRQQLLDELQELTSRMMEAEETLSAIRNGEVDGLVVSTAEGDRLRRGCARRLQPRQPVPGHRADGRAERPTSRDFGEFQLHYNAVRTDVLTPEVARAYGIAGSANRVLLNVSVLRENPDGTTAPADGTVTATAYNLNGQLKDLAMRRITEGSSVYFIGEVAIAGDEILVFDIDAVPAGQSSKYSVQFKREFFAG